MHLIDIPQQLYDDKDLGTILRPALPNIPNLIWGQASTAYSWRFHQSIYVSAEGADLDAILAVPTTKYLGQCASKSKFDKAKAASKFDKSARDDIVAMYQSLSIAEEIKELANKNSSIVALTTGASDNFVGTDLDNINGRTMSPGPGTWVIDTGSASIFTNQLLAGVATTRGHDSNTSNRPNQRATIAIVSANVGAMGRWVDDNNFVLAFCNGSNVEQLYEKVAGSLGQIGSNGPGGLAGANTLAIDCSGSQASVLVQGAVTIGPATIVATTGKWGFWANAASQLDVFLGEYSSGGNSFYYMRNQ